MKTPQKLYTILPQNSRWKYIAPYSNIFFYHFPAPLSLIHFFFCIFTWFVNIGSALVLRGKKEWNISNTSHPLCMWIHSIHTHSSSSNYKAVLHLIQVKFRNIVRTNDWPNVFLPSRATRLSVVPEDSVGPVQRLHGNGPRDNCPVLRPANPRSVSYTGLKYCWYGVQHYPINQSTVSHRYILTMWTKQMEFSLT